MPITLRFGKWPSDDHRLLVVIKPDGTYERWEGRQRRIVAHSTEGFTPEEVETLRSQPEERLLEPQTS